MFRVALFEPEIPSNTGNISRLCVGARAELLLIGKLGFTLDNARMRRAGLDHWDDLTLTLLPNLDALMAETPPERLAIFSKRGQRHYWEREYNPGDVLLFGCETRGLPAEFLEQHADKVYTIPMIGPVRSLNLSNSVAVVVYEGIRQQAAAGKAPSFVKSDDTGTLAESFDIRK